ncbi:hypothetical protein BDD43_4067 [Mucilaginibacter gracilis]|uniref:Uncharacterized protein n=1 Tax=Mucilaginibacter gracilis TaxID=423350 RepID=A0A495J5F7_9SPHI|nr:hypothetical protein BDD43_4067 [Mucilaginibacter gracilis]
MSIKPKKIIYFNWKLLSRLWLMKSLRYLILHKATNHRLADTNSSSYCSAL